MAETEVDDQRAVIRVVLAATRAQASPLFNAIAARLCTRGDYDSRPLSNEELGLLERAGSSDRVRMLLIIERPAVERVLDYVVQANTLQMENPALVREHKAQVPLSFLIIAAAVSSSNCASSRMTRPVRSSIFCC